jgi:hypothetical protein
MSNDRMEVKTIYSDWADIEQKLRDKQVHMIAFAEEGKSVFKAYGEFIGKISNEVLINYCYQANRMYGFITVFPLMNLSAIAKKYFRKEMTEPEKVRFEQIIRSIFKLDTVFIKSKHLIFNFTCAVQNKDFIVQCINSVAKEFEYPKSEIEICEIWLDEAIFTG